MFEDILKSEEYDFLRTNEHLKGSIILLGLGGSYAYGTNVETSDIDLRGVATNSKSELLTNSNFEQLVDEKTDTTIYSFNKIISLLCNCNPNVIEMLGLRPDHYLILTDTGKKLIDNKSLFLSKKAAASFGGYATAQLRRLDNKSARTLTDTLHEEHILGSIKNAERTFPERYFQYPEDAIRLYVDSPAVNPEMEAEIFMDINLKHYPLRDYKCMQADMHSIVKEYAKIGKRNSHAINRDKLGKHMMHLIRLYLMGLDILEKGEIVTYREKEHDFLMDIRNGKYLIDNQPTDEFMDMVDYYENRMNLAKAKSDLPDSPNYKKINDLMEEVNQDIILKNLT